MHVGLLKKTAVTSEYHLEEELKTRDLPDEAVSHPIEDLEDGSTERTVDFSHWWLDAEDIVDVEAIVTDLCQEDSIHVCRSGTSHCQNARNHSTPKSPSLKGLFNISNYNDATGHPIGINDDPNCTMKPVEPKCAHTIITKQLELSETEDCTISNYDVLDIGEDRFSAAVPQVKLLILRAHSTHLLAAQAMDDMNESHPIPLVIEIQHQFDDDVSIVPDPIFLERTTSAHWPHRQSIGARVKSMFGLKKSKLCSFLFKQNSHPEEKAIPIQKQRRTYLRQSSRFLQSPVAAETAQPFCEQKTGRSPLLKHQSDHDLHDRSYSVRLNFRNILPRRQSNYPESCPRRMMKTSRSASLKTIASKGHLTQWRDMNDSATRRSSRYIQRCQSERLTL